MFRSIINAYTGKFTITAVRIAASMETLNDFIESFIEGYVANSFNRAVAVGFANISDIPYFETRQAIFDRAISFALPLNPSAVAANKQGENEPLRAEYLKCHMQAKDLEAAIVRALQGAGYAAVAFPHDDNFGLSERMIGAHACLGWIGKSGLLITKLFGPAVVVGTVFTEAPIDCSTQVILSRCGRCVQCQIVNGENPMNHEYANTADSIKFANFSPTELEKAWSDGSFADNEELSQISIYACPYTKAYLSRNGIDLD